MNKSIHILIVEDKSADADLAKHTIRKVLKGCEFQIVETREDFLNSLEAFQPDLILSDYSLPHFDGLKALQLAVKYAPLTPLIIWTGSISEDVAVECMKAGANNYVLKENIKRLAPAIVHALEERRLLVERKLAEEKYQSMIDNSIAGIFQSTPEGRYMNVNPAMARIYGYDFPEEMIEAVKSIADQIYVDSNRRNEFLRLLTSQDVIHDFEERNYRKDGSIIWTSTSARAVRDTGGSILYYEGFLEDITQRKKAEEVLQTSEKRFRALIENGLDNISLLEVDGTLIWESPATVRMLEYAPNEHVGHNIFELMHPDDMDWTSKLYAKLIQEPGTHQRGTFRLRRSDGTWRWVEAIVTNMLEEPSVNAIVVNYRDVTERKSAEEALLASEARFRIFVDHATDAFFLHDEQGVILDLNHQACESLGYSYEELIGLTPFDFDVDLEQSFLEQLGEQLRTGETVAFDTRYRRKDGIIFPVEVRISAFQEGGRAFSISLVRDITERKQAEEALRESQARYQNLVETSHDLVWSVDAEGTITFLNRATREIYGYEPEELIGRSFLEVMDPEHFHQEDFKNFKEVFAQAEEFREVESRVRHKDGREIILSANSIVMRNDDGNVIGVTGSSRDITLRKRVEDVFREERNLLRTLIDNVPDRIYAMDIQGRKTLSNTADWKASGVKIMEDVIGKTDFDTYPPELAEGFWQLDKAVLDSGRPIINFEEPGLDFEGNLVSILTTKIPLRDSDGNVIGLVGVGRDITERKRVELERQTLLEIMQGFANTTDLQELLELVHLSIKKVIYAENFFVVLYQQNKEVFEEIYSVDKYDPPASPSKLEKSITSYVFRSGEPLLLTQERFDELRAEGEVVLVGTNSASWLGVPLKTSGRVIGVIAVQDYENDNRYSEHDKDFLESIATQIALAIEHRQAGEALRESEEHYRTIFEGVQDAIFVESIDGRILMVNQRACEMFGYSQAEFLTKTVTDIVPQGHLVFAVDGRDIPLSAEPRETVNRRANGETFPVEISGRLQEINGEPVLLVAVRDITERKRTEDAEREQRVLAEALRDTAETLSSTLDYGEVLDHILAAVGRVVPHDAATIMLIEGETAHVVRSYGYDQRTFDFDVMGVKLPLAETNNLQQMLEIGQTVVVYNTHTYPGWKGLPETDWVRSNVGAPISVYGKVIGFILLDSQTPAFFTPIHAERLEAFANQAALAIHNAHLLQQAQEEIAERKRAEESLQAEREKAQKYLDIAGVMMLALDQNGTVTLINQKGCEILGYSTDEIIGKNWIENFLPEAMREELQSVFQQLISGDLQSPGYYENNVTTKSGEERLIAWHNTLVRDGQGAIISTLSSGEDITERKRAEAQLRVSEERFRQLADNIQEAFWMTDAESGEEIYLSSAAETIWERPIENLISEPDAFINTVFPDDQPAVLEAIEEEKNGKNMEVKYRILRPNGTVRWVWDRAFPILDDTGKVKRIAGLTADITERRESEIALMKSQGRYRELFDSSPISIWEEDYSLVKARIDRLLESGVTDLKEYFSSHPQGVIELASLVKITDANKAALELYKIEQKEVIFKELTEILSTHALSHFQEEILGLMSPSKRFTWEGIDMMADGRQIEVMVNGTVPHGYEEDWLKVIVSINDITERKRAEEEIHRRAKETSALLETSLALTNLDLRVTLETIGNSAKTLFAADGARIFLMEPDGQSLRCVLALQENSAAFANLRIKLGEGVTGAVAANGQAEIVNEMQNDPRGVQVPGTLDAEQEGIMFAPLKERDRTIGVLSVRRAGLERPFSSDDLQLLEAFASMAASAVSNARLFEETQHRLAELEALYENGLAVGRLLKPSEIAKRVINTFARYLPWHHVAIRLRKEESDDLELVAFNLPNLKEEKRAETEQHFATLINKIGQGLSGWAMQTGEAFRTGNVHGHPQYIDTQAGIQSGLYVPLKVGDRVIGVISVESEMPDAFIEQDERLLATLANQAAIAFENARLYETIQRELLERKRTEEALRASEGHYRELADSITDILFELDQDLRYTHWNRASEIFSGIPAKDVIGKSMQEVFGISEEQARQEEIYKSVLKERRARTFEIEVLAQGQRQALEITAYPSARGVSVVAKDVTKRKQLEIIMQKRFELMEFSAHHTLDELMQKTTDEVSELTGSSIGFFHFVKEDHVTLSMQTWSTNALQLFHAPFSEGAHLPLDQAGVWAEAARQRRPLIQNDYESLSKRKGLPQGHVPITREIVIPIIRNERIMAVMGIGNKPQEYTQHDLEIAERLADYAWDITERKQMEIALEAERNQLAQRVDERTADLSRANSNLARALRVKDEFLANMSHELRTPLNAILGLSESLGEQIAGPLNEKQQKYIATISESGHHLLSLINDILDLAKIDAGQITLDINKVDIQSVCQASLRMIKQLAQKKKQEVSLQIDSGLGLIWADERRLKQMIVNLLGNAVKFTPENGKLGLEVHGDEEANKISFTVWDEGIGIKQEDLARLFQPFIQLDSGLARETTGTGLGLALVAQMARLHGGSILADSEPEKGSRFTIVLPWEPALPLDAATRMKITGKFRAIKVDEKSQPTILLVEDTKEVTMMVKDYLELAGYKVVTAQDGVDAVVQAQLVRPDLILMDVQMPRMDGLDATRKLRSEPDFRYTPIIALTALAMPSDREKCLDAGMDDYISKPIDLKALVKIIQGCLFNNQEVKSR